VLPRGKIALALDGAVVQADAALDVVLRRVLAHHPPGTAETLSSWDRGRWKTWT
jgi:hypothetical protein